MTSSESYVGFPALREPDVLVEALVHDPPEVRWRVVRELFRIGDPKDSEELIEKLRPHLFEEQDFRIKYRIMMALQALHRPTQGSGFVLVRGKGAFRDSEIGPGGPGEETSEHLEAGQDFFPVVDFHVHPKMPDLRFFADMKTAGVTHAVILATDTDPSDVDRPEVRERLQRDYAPSPQANHVPFEKMLAQIKSSLYSQTHVTNTDVADWVADYPDILIGFGSVNLSKDPAYVEAKLDEIEALNLRGIKLLPYSQFFDPSENENVDLLFDYCRRTGSIVLSHTGCGAGPFEILELSRNARPELWEPIVKKYPEVPLVLAHFGSYSSYIPGIWLQEAAQLGKKYRNVYADLAAVDWLLDREMVVNEIRKTITFDRVLFGTDYPLPLTAGVSLAYLVGGLKANSLLNEREKRKVLGENAARLLRIG
jgi:predicted TIM-barrel fold metal-dependent hydrolase